MTAGERDLRLAIADAAGAYLAAATGPERSLPAAQAAQARLIALLQQRREERRTELQAQGSDDGTERTEP
jgi:hypothetical protein